MPSSPSRRARGLLYSASICALTLVTASQPAFTRSVLKPIAGNTITVNSTLDVANGSDGLCTLREAITAANSDAASGGTAGECAAGSSTDPDTISLAGVTGTITLGSALPSITTEVTINGPGASQLTISGNTAF